jgi:hypothetical protein
MKAAGMAQTGSSGSIASTSQVASTPRWRLLLRKVRASRRRVPDMYLPSIGVAQFPVSEQRPVKSISDWSVR